MEKPAAERIGEIQRIERSDWLCAAILVAGVFLLYLRTLCPTVYLGDAGEITTAIVSGGVVHPPGYPLFSLLGRAALVLVPVGEPAFRIGCVVVLAAALAVGVLFFVGRELGAGRPAAFAGAALFGAGFTLWNQSTRVEVYSLHTLLVALTILFALRYRRTGVLRDILLTALFGSLGFAHHTTIVLLTPALLVWVGPHLWGDPGRGKRIGLVVAVLLTGPALYLLLPVWARSGAIQAWGRPTNLSLLWIHASAKQYQGNLHLPDAHWLGHRFSELGRIVRDQFPWGAFLLPPAGLALLWKRERALAAGFVLAVLVPVGFNLCYRIEDIAAYYLSPLFSTSVLLIVAVQVLDRLPRAEIRRLALASIAVVVLAANGVFQNWKACDLSRATWVREFTRQKLESVAANGVLITKGDDDTSPAWYVHDVLHVRPDVTLVDRAMCAGTWLNYEFEPSLWYLYRLRAEGVRLPESNPPDDPALRQALGQDGFLIRLLTHELAGRPVYLTGVSTLPGPHGQEFNRWAAERFEAVPVGLDLELHPKSSRVDLAGLIRRNEELWSGTIQLPDLGGVRLDEDLDATYLTNQYASMLVNFGNLKEMGGDLAGAEAIYQRASEWNPQFRAAGEALEGVRAKRRRGDRE